VPKIPLYNKGLGPSVDVATGQLGTSIDAQALSSPARQLASLGETIGQAGQNFAQNQINYNSRKARIDFEFEKAEQTRETQKLSDEISRKYDGIADDYNLRNRTSFTETASAANAFNVQVTDLAKQEISNLNVTDNNKSIIERRVLNSLAPKLSNAKKNAYVHGTNESVRSHDASFATMLQNIQPDDTFPELAAKVSDFQQKGENLIANGGTPSVLPSQVEAAVLGTYMQSSISAATTVDRVDELASSIDALAVPNAVKKTLRSDASVKRTSIISQNAEAIQGDINNLDLRNFSSDDLEDTAQQIRDGSDVVTLMFEVPDPDGNKVVARRIDLTGATEGQRGNVISLLAAAADRKETDESIALVDSVKTVAVRLDLPQLTDEIELAEQGKGLAEGTEGAVRSSILSALESEFNSRKPQVEAQITSNIERIQDSITRGNGAITEKTQGLVNETEGLYRQLEQNVEATVFKNTVKATVRAGEIFSNIQFATPTANKEAVDALAKEVDAQPVDAPVRASITQSSLKDMMKLRDAEMKNDPVRYLSREKGELTIDEVIALQRTMGVAEVDVRVTSNAAILEFRNEYEQAETYDAKVEVLENFLKPFGVNESRVMRHLRRTDTLSLVENVVANLGSNNIYSKLVLDGNQPDEIKAAQATVAKGGLGAQVFTELYAAANERLSEYNSSVIGGVVVDGVVGGGVQDGRTDHLRGMLNIVVNSAAYLKMADREKSIDDVIDVAFEAVIGNQYVFSDINNMSVRFESSLENDYVGMTDLLEFSLTQSEDYLRSVVNVPRKPGESDEEYENSVNEYFSDTLRSGSWRTTVDNQGVYMVDQLGGLVELKEPEDSDEPFAGFVFTSMDKVQSLLAQERAFAALSVDERRAKLTEMGYERPTFSLDDAGTIKQWRRLTFAQGPLF
jgi:hypothetical protein